MLKRSFDIFLALIALMLLAPVLLLTAALVRLTSRGAVLYWSQRVGRKNQLFSMPKFRTMRVDTPQVATHLLIDARYWMTPVGKFLRKSSLDELPQLWSVLVGDMSFVGPRPALFNQDDLVQMRTEVGVEQLVPGITGWAQINGRDELSLPDKVRFDAEYLQRMSLSFDLRILVGTVSKVLRRDGIQQATTDTTEEQPQQHLPAA